MNRLAAYFILAILALSQFHGFEHGISSLAHVHHDEEQPAQSHPSDRGDGAKEMHVSGALRLVVCEVPIVFGVLIYSPTVSGEVTLARLFNASPPTGAPPFYITHLTLLI